MRLAFIAVLTAALVAAGAAQARPAHRQTHSAAHAHRAWGNPVNLPDGNWGIFNDDPVLPDNGAPPPPDYEGGNPPVGTPDPWTLPGGTVIPGDGDDEWFTNVQDPDTGGWTWVPVHYGYNFTIYGTNVSGGDQDPGPAPDDQSSVPPSDTYTSDDPCLTAPWEDGCAGS